MVTMGHKFTSDLFSKLVCRTCKLPEAFLDVRAEDGVKTFECRSCGSRWIEREPEPERRRTRIDG